MDPVVNPHPRLSPKPGDWYYLINSDLLVALKQFATPESVTILDYGAGLAPYRPLFPQGKYCRADIAPPREETLGRDAAYPEPDYIISRDGRIPREANTFDFILSTQVLEHVADPYTYLSEAYRLLKPGGKLLLTTHGSWHDHGCPYDFRRWTADGLKYDLHTIGFKIRSVEKLTTGPRAMLWFLQMYLSTDGPSRRTFLGLFHWLSRFVPLRWLHTQADRLYPDCRVVPSEDPGHKLYLGIAVFAEREL
jgi:SAM-dependent methyltransferase